jgi:LuxR family maltose regulon positive regulatory protein
VGRKRLHDLLRLGATVPLTLVAAPAGWGKSTLVADWLGHDSPAAGWVSLDDGDNDPKRFWRYLLLAAAQAGRQVRAPPAGRRGLLRAAGRAAGVHQ